MTVRQLMAHTAGLTYGIFEPGTVLAKAYSAARLRDPARSLKDFITDLAPLPLAFQPGTRWEYSVATDVLGYLVEVVSGESFGDFLEQHILKPLAMVDTGFFVPPAKLDRLAALYVGVDITNPVKPGLLRADASPYPGAYRERPVFESGGGGLVTTLGDTVRLIQALMPGGPGLLAPETITMMASNQLPAGMWVEPRNGS